MWLDLDSNVPGEVTRKQLYNLLESAKRDGEIPIYVVFPRQHSKVMLKRKLTPTSYIENPNFLWYSDRDDVTKRVGSDAKAAIFTNYFHAYAYWQKVLKGLVDA